ncbi:lipid II flippase MurJ [Orrella sp. JC864]|uniref:murein biosynthesis integral membrane protein MurJ n=1 Tax=Orrella sp. JC864 TaxID=3120298 RepID=UPI003008D852
MKALRQRLARLHPDHRRIASGAFRVAIFLVLGKAAGAFKEMAVAYRYGVSDAVDAYQFTLTMATWLPVTAVSVLSVVLIPVLVRVNRSAEADRARFVGELQMLALVLALALGALTWLAWPLVLQVVGSGLSENVQAMSRQLLWAFAPVAAFTLLAGISAARLRARERHVNTLLDSVPAVAVLAWVMLAFNAQGVGPLLWGTLVGFAVQAAWLAWLAARADGAWGRPLWGMRSAHWPEVMKAAGVMLIGQVAMSFVGPIDQYTAANLGQNANATLGYAARLLSLLLGIGAVSVGRAALPVLADVQSRGEVHRARAMALKWSALMVLAGAGAVAVGWVLAPWGVAFLFERGAFTAQDTQAVAGVLRWGMLQLPFYFGVLVLVQLLASQNRYRIMALIAVANFGLKAVLNPVLAPLMGTAGIMLATSLMYLLSYVCYVFAALRPPPAAAVSKGESA